MPNYRFCRFCLLLSTSSCWVSQWIAFSENGHLKGKGVICVGTVNAELLGIFKLIPARSCKGSRSMAKFHQGQIQEFLDEPPG